MRLLGSLKRLRLVSPDWLTVLSSALIVFAFPPWNVYPLIWVSLIPWFGALERAPSWKKAFLQGVWLSVLMTLGGFYWIAHVMREFAGLSQPAAIACLLAVALVGQPQFLVFAPLWRWARGRAARPPLGWALWLAALYTGIDWLSPKLFVDTLGHCLYLARYLRQGADVGGAMLLTFVIFFFNESAYRFLTHLRARKEPSLWPALRLTGGPMLLSLALVAALWLYGRARYAQIVGLETHPKQTFQAAVIQANIGDFEKLASERGLKGASDRVLETFFAMSDEALTHRPRPQAVIWPETSYPSTFRTPSNAIEMERDHRVENYARTRDIPVLFGGYDHANGKDFNAFFFLSPKPHPGVEGPGDLQVYRKNVLLLFGEYIPGADYFDFIHDAFPQVGNFGHGVGPSVLQIPTGDDGPSVPVGPIICYEALFPNYVIAAARKGSRMILNITNDSWFGTSGEPILHLSLTTFRSIETRLPQLRSTNTGISALILPDGEITQPTQVGSTDILHATVPLLDPIPTLMKAWGDWFGPFALTAGCLGLAAVLWVDRRRATATHTPK